VLTKILDLLKPRQNELSKEDESKELLISSIALLLEVAKSDNSISQEELEQIALLASKQFEISNEEQDELVGIAKNVVRDSTSLYQYTTIINDNYSQEKKQQLIYSMWCVAFADGRIDRYEEHLIRKIADLIYVPHVKFIESKHDAQRACQ